MSKKRDKIRERKRALWEQAKRAQLDRARERIGLAPDEVIPDAVLLAEVDGYLPRHAGHDSDLGKREQWFGFRLMGLADTEAERTQLAHRLAGYSSKRTVWGLGASKASRRSPAAGRRRNRRRFEDLTQD